MAISEIEKLERRYQENPQGLTFAPLAEAYRKSGDPERALARLLPGLELHPDYIPASIVQGRCFLDLQNDAGAETAFSHVLSLDAENVIALKALADIAERGARFGDAERWLEQLLAVDRSNDDAEAQLERVRAARLEVAASAESAEPEAFDAPSGDVAAVEGLEVEATLELEPPAPVDELPPLPTVERATEDARLEEEAPPPLPFRVDSDAAVLDDAILGVTQLGGGDEIVLEAAPVTEYQLPSASEDFGKGLSIDAASGASEFQLPSASEELDLKPSEAVSEYQLPSASDDLVLPDLGATGAASEYQLPDASTDLSAVPLTGTEANEFQAPDAAHDFRAGQERAAEGVAEAAAEAAEIAAETAATEAARAEGAPEEPPGQWSTWSDAALDAEAPPFDEESVPAPFEEEAPAPWAAVASSREPAPAFEPEPPPIPVVEVTIVEAVEVVTSADVVDLDDLGEAAGEPDLVITESMAELFLAQGHPADALRVYRQLLERRPGDERLVQLVARLDVEAAQAEPTPRLAASVSGGTSVREMMRSLMGSRPNGVERPVAPAAASGPDAPGSPTRPAPDHLTLSAIFGDDAAPLPPVMRPPPARPPADRGVTFDEFYGTPTRGAPAGRERTTRVAQGDDDLDQFHDWLQNLKR